MVLPWTRLSLVNPPASDPVTLDEAKAHLNVFHTDDDALITALIKSAAGMIDGPDGIGYALEQQSWLLTLDAFDCSEQWARSGANRHDGRVIVPLRPVISIDEIRYLDADGVEQTFAADQYRVSIQGGAGIVTPVSGWPTHLNAPGAARIEFTAGAGTPPALRAAVLLMVGHLYEHREAVSTAMAEVPLAWESIVSRYRSGMVA